jgi:hypothetical protein
MIKKKKALVRKFISESLNFREEPKFAYLNIHNLFPRTLC